MTGVCLKSRHLDTEIHTHGGGCLETVASCSATSWGRGLERVLPVYGPAATISEQQTSGPQLPEMARLSL